MPDVTALILEDHRQMKEVFAKLEAGSADQRRLLLPVVSSMLIAHSRAEESQVYPAVRDEAGDADDVEHSQEEHAAAELALVKVVETDPGSEAFAPVLAAFVEAVTHHMEEEESDVLPAMRTGLSASRLDQLGEAFLTARAAHWGDRPGEASRDDLAVQAQNAGISGRSQMSKDELKAAVEGSAEL